MTFLHLDLSNIYKKESSSKNTKSHQKTNPIKKLLSPLKKLLSRVGLTSSKLSKPSTQLPQTSLINLPSPPSTWQSQISENLLPLRNIGDGHEKFTNTQNEKKMSLLHKAEMAKRKRL